MDETYETEVTPLCSRDQLVLVVGVVWTPRPRLPVVAVSVLLGRLYSLLVVGMGRPSGVRNLFKCEEGIYQMKVGGERV